MKKGIWIGVWIVFAIVVNCLGVVYADEDFHKKDMTFVNKDKICFRLLNFMQEPKKVPDPKARKPATLSESKTSDLRYPLAPEPNFTRSPFWIGKLSLSVSQRTRAGGIVDKNNARRMTNYFSSILYYEDTPLEYIGCFISIPFTNSNPEDRARRVHSDGGLDDISFGTKVSATDKDLRLTVAGGVNVGLGTGNCRPARVGQPQNATIEFFFASWKGITENWHLFSDVSVITPMNLRSDALNPADRAYNDLKWDLALVWAITKSFSLIGEMNGLSRISGTNIGHCTVYLSPGIRYKIIDTVQFNLGAQAPVITGRKRFHTDYDWAGLMGISWYF